MNALITGISGFVGGHLADHLLAAGDMVLGATRDGRWLPDFSLPIPLVAWELGAEEAASDLCDRIATFAPDVIYHLAALSIPADCGAAGAAGIAMTFGACNLTADAPGDGWSEKTGPDLSLDS